MAPRSVTILGFKSGVGRDNELDGTSEYGFEKNILLPAFVILHILPKVMCGDREHDRIL